MKYTLLVCILMSFDSVYLDLCNLHPDKDEEHFHHTRKFPLAFLHQSWEKLKSSDVLVEILKVRKPRKNIFKVCSVL